MVRTKEDIKEESYEEKVDIMEVVEVVGKGEELEEEEEYEECLLGRLEEHNLEWMVQRVLLLLDLVSLHVARQVGGAVYTMQLYTMHYSPLHCMRRDRFAKGGTTTSSAWPGAVDLDGKKRRKSKEEKTKEGNNRNIPNLMRVQTAAGGPAARAVARGGAAQD
jgi:hypothetical protein